MEDKDIQFNSKWAFLTHIEQNSMSVDPISKFKLSIKQFYSLIFKLTQLCLDEEEFPIENSNEISLINLKELNLAVPQSLQRKCKKLKLIINLMS